MVFSIKDFNTEGSVSSGGVTGSKKVTKRDKDSQSKINFQLKPSIKSNKFLRRVKVGGLDKENFGEFIAAQISGAMVNKAEGVKFVPEVYLVHDEETHRCLIASRYLDGVEGTLDSYAEKTGVVAKGKHVKFTTDATQAEGEFSIAGDEKKTLREDLARAVTLSVLAGDHDVNPGNMIVSRGPNSKVDRISRIDFGHAFNDLLSAPKIFGGQVRNKENRVLDFLNRETVSNINPSAQGTKLWRDYDGIVPSEELYNAFKDLSSNEAIQNSKQGIKKAETEFKELINKDPQLKDHVEKSLIGINETIGGKKIDKKRDVIDQVFKNLESFYTENQKQMLDVAKLMRLQLDVDKLLSLDKNSKEYGELHKNLGTAYNELAEVKGIQNNKGVEWIKSNKDTPPFKGSLNEYIEHRKELLKERAVSAEQETPKDSKDVKEPATGNITVIKQELQKAADYEQAVGIYQTQVKEQKLVPFKESGRTQKGDTLIVTYVRPGVKESDPRNHVNYKIKNGQLIGIEVGENVSCILPPQKCGAKGVEVVSIDRGTIEPLLEKDNSKSTIEIKVNKTYRSSSLSPDHTPAKYLSKTRERS